MNPVSKSGEQTLIRVYVQPGASKNEFVGLYGDPPRLKIKVKAQPQDGAANAEVITFLAKTWGVSTSKVSLLRGHTSRQKDILVDMDYEAVIKLIP